MKIKNHELILLITVIISLILCFIVFPLASRALIGGWCPPMLVLHFISFTLWIIGFGYYGYVEAFKSKRGGGT